MKKILFVAMLCASTALVGVTACVAAVTTTPASAPSAGGTAASGGGGNFGGPGGGQGGGHERFEERKADAERRIRDHIAKMQERLSCVEAAKDHEALKACLPERGRGGFGGGHGGGHEGGGHEGGGHDGGGQGEEEPAPNSQ